MRFYQVISRGARSQDWIPRENWSLHLTSSQGGPGKNPDRFAADPEGSVREVRL